MAFTINYFKRGLQVWTWRWDCSVEETITKARDGLAEYRAAYAFILDDKGAKAATVKS